MKKNKRLVIILHFIMEIFHGRKQQLSRTHHYFRFYFLEHENDSGWCFKQEISNNSMNLWSDTLALAPANLWYSSKTDDRHHLCNLLMHPTRQPVRCFPRLQWISRGWFLTSRATFKASRIVSFGMLTKGSLQPSIPNW